MKIIVVHYVHYDYHKFSQYLGACLPMDFEEKLPEMILKYVSRNGYRDYVHERFLKLPVMFSDQSPENERPHMNAHFALTVEEI